MAEPGSLRARLTRQWRVALAIVVGSLVIAGAVVVSSSSEAATPGTAAQPPSLLTSDQLRQPIHEHADFALFIRGQQFDFGQKQFVSYANDERSPNVHVHDPRHTVIHVHREGVTWDEFFRSEGFELVDSTNLAKREDTALKLPSGEWLRTTDKEHFTFIVNGVKVDGIAGLNIHGLERVLISYGSESDAEIQAQWGKVTDEACIPSGVCLDRGNGRGEHGDVEPCTASETTCSG